MYNTGNPIPSAALEDMADNARVLDQLVNKTDGTVTDRTGTVRRSFQQIIMDMGFEPLSGSFQSGATLTQRNQVLQDTSTGVFYSWNGELPKVVVAGATPATSGGIGAGAWVDRTDLTYRQEADKKFKYSVKLSDFTTLQDAVAAAVDGLLIDTDYHFPDGDIVDFGGKAITIDCKASFICDGSLIFTNLGEGSKIINPSLKSY